MIVHNAGLQGQALCGRVRVEASIGLPLDALFLGAPGRPSWDELKQAGPIRFDIDPGENETPGSQASAIVARDFGDSCVSCTSDAAATTAILPQHRQLDPRQIPTAMGFAFAQQWARLGYACIHGALLEVEGTGVLVLGLRAAGKSVLSTSALVAGGAIVSDDYLLAGERGGRLIGERIRGFLSLRLSWAARALFDSSTDAWHAGRSGHRAFLRIDEDDARFPGHCQIDRIWVLTRPKAGRRLDSKLEPISHADLYAALITATQPLLLGPDFPHERGLLTTWFTKLITQAPAARLETGQDIVLTPKQTWNRLLATA